MCVTDGVVKLQTLSPFVYVCSVILLSLSFSFSFVLLCCVSLHNLLHFLLSSVTPFHLLLFPQVHNFLLLIFLFSYFIISSVTLYAPLPSSRTSPKTQPNMCFQILSSAKCEARRSVIWGVQPPRMSRDVLQDTTITVFCSRRQFSRSALQLTERH